MYACIPFEVLCYISGWVQVKMSLRFLFNVVRLFGRDAFNFRNHKGSRPRDAAGDIFGFFVACLFPQYRFPFVTTPERIGVRGANFPGPISDFPHGIDISALVSPNSNLARNVYGQTCITYRPSGRKDGRPAGPQRETGSMSKKLQPNEWLRTNGRFDGAAPISARTDEPFTIYNVISCSMSSRFWPNFERPIGRVSFVISPLSRVHNIRG